MPMLTGACLCGAVKYSTSAAPVISGNCHCRDCQRSSGSAYAPVFFVPQGALSIRGEVRYYQSTGGSGLPVRRGFCPVCGSQLFALAELMPGLISVRAGTLDDTRQYQSGVEIFVSQAAVWDHIPDEALKFDTLPPRTPGA
ncbi:GFA family protein [Uliginosibacterium paludis]|uniref:GFA family protein n=1 Tax=Uliginosibacterium paludis TaxID=1615952 RepID=A0ABV2CLL9_9RHOO